MTLWRECERGQRSASGVGANKTNGNRRKETVGSELELPGPGPGLHSRLGATGRSVLATSECREVTVGSGKRTEIYRLAELARTGVAAGRRPVGPTPDVGGRKRRPSRSGWRAAQRPGVASDGASIPVYLASVLVSLLQRCRSGKCTCAGSTGSLRKV